MTRRSCFTPILNTIVNAIKAPFASAPPIQLAQEEEIVPLYLHEKGSHSFVSEVAVCEDESFKAQESIVQAPLISLSDVPSGSDINSLRATGHQLFKTLGDDALRILVLCLFLDSSSISLLVLHRGALPQPRWSQAGNIEDHLVTAGRDLYLLEVLSNLPRLRKGLGELLEKGVVVGYYAEGELASISINKNSSGALRDMLGAHNAAYWSEQALLTVCNAIPRDKHICSNFRSFGQLCLAHLDTAFDFFKVFNSGSVANENVHEDIVTAGVAATFFSTMAWKLNMLTLVEPYATSPISRILVAARRKTLLRIDRKDVSDILIGRLIDPARRHDSRTNAQAKLARISAAWDFIEKSQYDEAIVYLTSILSELGQPSNTMEVLAEFQAKLGIARCRRTNGDFVQALGLIKAYAELAATTPVLAPHHQEVVVEMADLLCELRQPYAAQELIEAHFYRFANPSPLWNRRVWLSYAESLVRSDRLGEAKCLLFWLEGDFESSKEISRSARLRLECLMARAYHIRQSWESACTHWAKALALAEEYTVSDGQASAMIYGALAHVFYKKKNWQRAKVMLDASRTAARPGYREQFWIPGLNDFWHRHVEPELLETDTLEGRRELEYVCDSLYMEGVESAKLGRYAWSKLNIGK